MSPIRTADEKGSGRPLRVERGRYSGPLFICSSSVDHLAIAAAPDIGHTDEAVAFPDFDPAPPVAALADSPDDARLRQIARLCIVIGADPDRSRLPRLDDRRTPIR